MLNADLAALKIHMAENPGAVIEDVARERNVTPRMVLEALPEGMVTIGGGADAFVTAMTDIAGWGEVTLIVHTEDGIFETTAPLSAGAIGHGYYNLTQPRACTAICVMSAAAALLSSSGRSWASRRPSSHSSMSMVA
jgi:putative heme iron utilization protein